MLKQIKIIFDPNQTETKKGDFFENLMRDVFETQRYTIKQRVNFTGMEIDLIAQHLDRNETAYIECKAREQLESNELKTFAFNVNHHKANFGYFLSTTEYSHQVAGLIEEMKNDSRYSNLYFWGPGKIIELLESSDKIKPIKLEIKDNEKQITKTILTYSAMGVFYVHILSEGSLPTHFWIHNASNPTANVTEKNIEDIRENLQEIKNLMPYEFKSSISDVVPYLEIVAEIQESEDWADYRPASSKHFVGRIDLRNELFKFIKQANQDETSRRIFYIDGKSGWGKSSLINDLKGRCANKRNRNKYFVLAIDTRSANTSNFVALAFKKLIESAYSKGFIEESLFNKAGISISSSYDILASDSVKQLLNTLTAEGKILVIVFDQFEDVFRKVDLFKAFHKFLLDVNDVRTSLVVGFSWRSEINIPISHEAYNLWQQSKDIASCISLREFNSSETNSVIKQLEKAVARTIDIDLKRKLIESSQGFPWLIKKLCIHAYKQIKMGVTIEKLIEQDLNCEALFKNDLEALSPEETRSLKYIAQRSFDGNFFDATEIDEAIPNDIIAELINKRLVVKSGTKYNVYWDIFRDYIVTDKVPPIGESYLIRQYVRVCIDVFKLFNVNKLTLIELSQLYKKGSIRTLDNILRELRNIGLIRKDVEHFQMKRHDLKDEKVLKEYLRSKLDRHTAHIRLKESEHKLIGLKEIVTTFKQIFKINFAEKTWSTYSKYFVSWLNYVGLDFNGRLTPSLRKGFKSREHYPNRETFTPQSRPQKIVETFSFVVNKNISDFKRIYHELYDLKVLGLITYSGNKIQLTDKGLMASKHVGTDEFDKLISKEAIQTKKIRQAVNIFTSNPSCSKKEFADALANVISGISSPIYKKQTIAVLFAWAKFVYSSGASRLNPKAD
ncbi:MAG: restriction endonuclease [Thermodesulfovibrionales bacterium]|nr:restriction endonuclease [Thermodesulfovibrionales bacterium]